MPGRADTKNVVLIALKMDGLAIEVTQCDV